MASGSVCSSCLRAIRLQVRKDLRFSRQQPPYIGLHQRTYRTRAFSTSPTFQEEKKTSSPPPPRFSKPASSESSTQQDAIANFAQGVRKRETFKGTTEPYIAYGSTEDLFRECSRQCSYTIPNAQKQPPEAPPKNAAGEDIGVGEGWWYQPREAGGLGLDVTFNTWAQVMFLHMYMLTARLRCFPAEHSKVWHQNLLDHFFYAAEDRMAMWHGMAARGIRNKNLKDLALQWRGVLFAYDEGIVKGDAVLAGAVWRNVFKASNEARVEDLALVTAYMRSQMQMLDGISDERLSTGDVKFSNPGSSKQLLDKESPWMKKAIGEEDMKAAEKESDQ